MSPHPRTRLSAERREELQQVAIRTRLARLNYQARTGNECLDCGEAISPKARRCLKCAGVARRKPRQGRQAPLPAKAFRVAPLRMTDGQLARAAAAVLQELERRQQERREGRTG